MPLLNGCKINSLSIGIDLLGFCLGSSEYRYGDSNFENGSYSFLISDELLNQYLEKYHHLSIQYTDFHKYTWVHELIHMLDHRNLIKHKFYITSVDPREFIIQYL